MIVDNAVNDHASFTELVTLLVRNLVNRRSQGNESEQLAKAREPISIGQFISSHRAELIDGSSDLNNGVHLHWPANGRPAEILVKKIVLGRKIHEKTTLFGLKSASNLFAEKLIGHPNASRIVYELLLSCLKEELKNSDTLPFYFIDPDGMTNYDQLAFNVDKEYVHDQSEEGSEQTCYSVVFNRYRGHQFASLERAVAVILSSFGASIDPIMPITFNKADLLELLEKAHEYRLDFNMKNFVLSNGLAVEFVKTVKRGEFRMVFGQNNTLGILFDPTLGVCELQPTLAETVKFARKFVQCFSQELHKLRKVTTDCDLFSFDELIS